MSDGYVVLYTDFVVKPENPFVWEETTPIGFSESYVVPETTSVYVEDDVSYTMTETKSYSVTIAGNSSSDAIGWGYSETVSVTTQYSRSGSDGSSLIYTSTDHYTFFATGTNAGTSYTFMLDSDCEYSGRQTVSSSEITETSSSNSSVTYTWSGSSQYTETITNTLTASGSMTASNRGDSQSEHTESVSGNSSYSYTIDEETGNYTKRLATSYTCSSESDFDLHGNIAPENQADRAWNWTGSATLSEDVTYTSGYTGSGSFSKETSELAYSGSSSESSQDSYSSESTADYVVISDRSGWSLTSGVVAEDLSSQAGVTYLSSGSFHSSVDSGTLHGSENASFYDYSNHQSTSTTELSSSYSPSGGWNTTGSSTAIETGSENHTWSNEISVSDTVDGWNKSGTFEEGESSAYSYNVTSGWDWDAADEIWLLTSGNGTTIYSGSYDYDTLVSGLITSVANGTTINGSSTTESSDHDEYQTIITSSVSDHEWQDVGTGNECSCGSWSSLFNYSESTNAVTDDGETYSRSTIETSSNESSYHYSSLSAYSDEDGWRYTSGSGSSLANGETAFSSNWSRSGEWSSSCGCGCGYGCGCGCGYIPEQPLTSTSRASSGTTIITSDYTVNNPATIQDGVWVETGIWTENSSDATTENQSETITIQYPSDSGTQVITSSRASSDTSASHTVHGWVNDGWVVTSGNAQSETISTSTESDDLTDKTYSYTISGGTVEGTEEKRFNSTKTQTYVVNSTFASGQWEKTGSATYNTTSASSSSREGSGTYSQYVNGVPVDGDYDESYAQSSTTSSNIYLTLGSDGSWDTTGTSDVTVNTSGSSSQTMSGSGSLTTTSNTDTGSSSTTATVSESASSANSHTSSTTTTISGNTTTVTLNSSSENSGNYSYDYTRNSTNSSNSTNSYGYCVSYSNSGNVTESRRTSGSSTKSVAGSVSFNREGVGSGSVTGTSSAHGSATYNYDSESNSTERTTGSSYSRVSHSDYTSSSSTSDECDVTDSYTVTFDENGIHYPESCGCGCGYGGYGCEITSNHVSGSHEYTDDSHNYGSESWSSPGCGCGCGGYGCDGGCSCSCSWDYHANCGSGYGCGCGCGASYDMYVDYSGFYSGRYYPVNSSNVLPGVNGSVRSETASAAVRLAENLVAPSASSSTTTTSSGSASSSSSSISSGNDSVGWAFLKGLAQGVLNFVNVLTSGAIATANLGLFLQYYTTPYGPIVRLLGVSPRYFPITDWSRGLIVDEGTVFGMDAHNVSVTSIDIGLTCLSAANLLKSVGRATTAVSKGSCPGGKCFTAGTQIVTGVNVTVDGVVQYETKSIEDVQVGDLVYSYNTVSGEYGYREVTDVYIRVTDSLNQLTIEDANGNIQVIETTDGHPFWVMTDAPDLNRAASDYSDETYHGELAPTEHGYWVEAKDLQVGDVFLGVDGELSTLTNTIRVEQTESVDVFNFTVEGNHDYFVLEKDYDYGQTCVLVHNASGKYAKGKAVDDTRKVINCEEEAVYRGGKIKLRVQIDETKHKVEDGIIGEHNPRLNPDVIVKDETVMRTILGSHNVEQPAGVSVNTVFGKAKKFGPPTHQIDSIPDGLEIIQSGDSPTHYVISPARDGMTLQEYVQKLDEIVMHEVTGPSVQ